MKTIQENLDDLETKLNLKFSVTRQTSNVVEDMFKEVAGVKADRQAKCRFYFVDNRMTFMFADLEDKEATMLKDYMVKEGDDTAKLSSKEGTLADFPATPTVIRWKNDHANDKIKIQVLEVDGNKFCEKVFPAIMNRLEEYKKNKEGSLWWYQMKSDRHFSSMFKAAQPQRDPAREFEDKYRDSFYPRP